jgi:hypothetical protein
LAQPKLSIYAKSNLKNHTETGDRKNHTETAAKGSSNGSISDPFVGDFSPCFGKFERMFGTLVACFRLVLGHVYAHMTIWRNQN